MNFDDTGMEYDPFSIYEFDGDLPKGDFVLGVADYNYFLKYSEEYVNSALRNSNRVHLHILNPKEKIEGNDLFTVTTSYYPFDDVSLFSAYRFVIYKKLMSEAKYKMWQLDIDGRFNDKFFFDFNSIGLILRTKKDFPTRTNFDRMCKIWDSDWWGSYCGAFYITPSHIKFLDFIIDELKRSEKKWCMCQGSLYRAHLNNGHQFDFFQIDPMYINMWSDKKNRDKYKFYHYGKGLNLRMPK